MSEVIKTVANSNFDCERVSCFPLDLVYTRAMTSLQIRRPYFPGLHALRAYAALSVIVLHVRVYGTAWSGQATTWPLLDQFVLSGRNAVSLFLVLSGFLITYLMLHEQASTGTVSIKGFYRRRVLRIWPLYFGMLAICAVGWATTTHAEAFNDMGRSSVLLPLLTFTLNFALSGTTNSAMLVLWSVGIEEQFYAVWPLVVRRWRIPAIVAVGLILYLGLISMFDQINGLISYLLTYSRYDLLLLGALVGWMVHEQHPALQLARHNIVRALLVIAVLLIIFTDFDGIIYNALMYDAFIGLLSAIVIINIVGGWGVVENPVVRHLGNISFGMYVLHSLVIYVLVQLGVRSELLFVATLLGAIAVASLSYHFFERPFLRLKQRASLPTVLAPVGD